MKTKICGIDSSTSATSISLFEGNCFIDYELILGDKKKYPNKWDRLNPMIEDIFIKLDIFKPDIVFQEDDYKGNNIDNLKALTHILGAVRGWCIVNNANYYTLMPSEWRAKLGLNKYSAERNELKQMTKDYIENRYNIVVPQDDISDSIAIALAGLKILED